MKRCCEILLLSVILIFCVQAVIGDDTEGKSESTISPSFITLKQAVTFISTCLDMDDYEKLANACTKQDDKPSNQILKSLKAKHLERSLLERYASFEFPEKERTFKLGGHSKELGHIHIDFVKNDNQWFLLKIWMCR